MSLAFELFNGKAFNGPKVTFRITQMIACNLIRALKRTSNRPPSICLTTEEPFLIPKDFSVRNQCIIRICQHI